MFSQLGKLGEDIKALLEIREAQGKTLKCCMCIEGAPQKNTKKLKAKRTLQRLG